MKNKSTLVFMCLGLTCSVQSATWAEGSASGPMLVRKSGGIAHNGFVTTCEVHPNHYLIADKPNASHWK